MTDLLSPEEWDALRLSLRVAGVSLAASLPFAIGVALVLARKQFPGKLLLETLVHLPLVLPPVATGYVLLAVFGGTGPLGGWLRDAFGIELAFRWTGAALAAAIMAFPLMVRPMRVALEAVDPGLEDAAATLGAGRVRTLFAVTLPLAAPGIVAGAVLGFAKALGEFGATITLAANIPGETRTLPLAIWTALQTPGGETGAWRLTVVAAMIAVISLAAAEALTRSGRKHRA
jgi:molybdate transport system permease protein